MVCRRKRLPPWTSDSIEGYDSIVSELVDLVESARRVSARAVDSIMTATYWEIGRRIVESEQRGKRRAEYGEALLENLAFDLTAKFGRGFGLANLKNIRKFYVIWPEGDSIDQTASDQSASQRIDPASDEKGQTLSGLSTGGQGLARLRELAGRFPLPWSHCVRLLAVSNKEARKFYETEALRRGWSVRQLDRQISSQFYERTALSRNKVSMLKKPGKAEPGELLTPEKEIKDPFVLEFLGLKDEYSEADLEEALILHLEAFLLELGGAFIGRQRRLRIDDEWYRIDLLFFHRKLRCLIILDLLCGGPHNRSCVAFAVMWRSAGLDRFAAAIFLLSAT
jgi:predicted nuclease of restriction endonuclease-like (RecB) superfamily